MKYNKEAGVLLSTDEQPLLYVRGEAGHVDFPSEAIWKLHKANPGTVFNFIHTHPSGMTEASGLDISMITTWAKVLYPFPARISVLTYLENERYSFKTWFARWQDKEEWEKDKTQKRKVDLFLENSFHLDTKYIFEPWEDWLINFSYT